MARVRTKTKTKTEIDNDYVRSIMDRFGVHAKTEAVDLALRSPASPPMTRQQAMAMRGGYAMGEPPVDAAPRGAL